MSCNSTVVASSEGSRASLAQRRSVSRDVTYHAVRTLEELDLATTSDNPDARRVHEHMASLHLAAACRFYRADFMRSVAVTTDRGLGVTREG